MAGIYVHIPFCKSKCSYCDFHSESRLTNRRALVDALCAEIHLRKNYLSEPIKTLYFGGGTPSLLREEEWRQILSETERSFPLAQCTERTVEVNPDDINGEYAQMLRRLGFNRVSVGIQSFSNDDLRNINRRHNAEEAVQAVRELQKAGFANISIDLIFGLPGQTAEMWQRNLTTALSLGVQHISGYALTYEERTTLWRKLQRGEVSPASDELSLEMFRTMSETLKNGGFEHYEISNFALPGFRSKHNSAYWEGVPYLGIGPAAHSYNGTERRWNIHSNAIYIENIGQGKTFYKNEILTQTDKLNELIITQLRTKNGINLQNFRTTFGEKPEQTLLRNAARWLRNGKMEQNGDTLRLTNDGIFISDTIFSDLIFV